MAFARTPFSLLLLLLVCELLVVGQTVRQPSPEPLDHCYGKIFWEDEKARLDNFAIQLMNEPDYVGYIFVFNGHDFCPGEAQARAVRAKRYLVEHRRIPWNRVIWKEEGARDKGQTTLWIFKPNELIPYHLFSDLPSKNDGFSRTTCGSTISRIHNSKWK
jgi:hypothetical protein